MGQSVTVKFRRQITDPEHLQTFLKYKQFKKNSSCFTCGDSYYHNLEFHHVCFDDHKGGKITGKFLAVSAMVWANYPWEDVKDELDKCIPLCKTCHTEYHRKLGL
jgi:hypothetical protein